MIIIPGSNDDREQNEERNKNASKTELKSLISCLLHFHMYNEALFMYILISELRKRREETSTSRIHSI